ncbi:hydroxylysine kinase isoform X1 [Camelus dromedarius]|uniref:Hydroxylysine kinase n=2 Tax=Camelus TaxID=9836 RepID=A0A8B7K9H2_CAMFR|nr:hydroxylysine kinase isoform X1 [Camelus bactrianus]XP_010953502.1 hydroxylysine kinase isoform X1 [Camelus bactrianus]XP_010976130.1 hydroxylysine kinase isoform X1 [Camelus dromedarius]XP_010976131.1 hydroxylysine kinase isoform X1 [Camelus dromedarius]XP_014413749.1 hydroxylysine kinase isoform X1 [Camelus ferus]XP_014413753.1 hydroxylysine kinase isoform X1 [Camelus ferus]
MSSGDGQQSQALTKPAFSEVQASAIVDSVFGLKVSKIQPLPSYDDQNFHVCISRTKDTTDGPNECVLKINNTESSKTPDLIEVQSHIMMFLRAAGFPTASVYRTKGDHITSLTSIDSGSEIKSYLVRLLTYLPGRPIAEIPISSQLLYEIGRLAAKLDKTLEHSEGQHAGQIGRKPEWRQGVHPGSQCSNQNFHHPQLSSLHRENFIWNLKNVPLLEKYLYALGQNRKREIVEQVIQLFKDEVMTKLSHFRECINHGDLNDHNILIESSKSACGDAVYQVSGILDFDDMSYGYYVFEVAITIMYMMIESKTPIQVGGHVLAGFESVIPLTPVERGALFLLVCSRFCQSLVLAAYSCHLYPENEEYLMITAKTGWRHLQQMFDMGQKAVEEIWFETAKSYEPGISM